MKPEFIKADGQDRLATWEEIRHATSATPDSVLEFCHANGVYCEVDSDQGGVVRYPSEEFEFFALLSESDAAAN
jgi:hypothetical protein